MTGPKPSTFGMRLYRAFFRFIFRLGGRFLVGAQRWAETQKLSSLFASFPEKGEFDFRIWFHAASMGELESLWPLIERASREPRTRLILTVFSTSAWSHLHKMARKLEGIPPLYVGYSPLEGGWRRALEHAVPDLFVTAKYEAWPEIWEGLAALDVPLAIIGAKPRSSILWAKRILAFLRAPIPHILFFSFDPENEPGLSRRFPSAEIYHGSDPRWDRVFQRSEHHHSRVAELAEEFRSLPRPWGVIGSAWPSDLAKLPHNAATVIPGTLWIVPHRIDPRSVSEIEIFLRDRGYTPMRTAIPDRIKPAGKISVLIDEMGFLAELYSLMDWAFIGGGFGSSVHSTIEPAIYGLPIFAGPRGQEKFDEIPLLRKQAQLFLSVGADDFLNWLNTELAESSEVRGDRRNEWKEANLRHRGASDRIWLKIKSHLQNKSPVAP